MINPAELNKLKDALYRDSSKEIAEAIIALAKNAENIIELMALCGFFHEHNCPKLASDFWKLVKDPYTKKHVENFSFSFIAAPEGWYRAVCSWYVTVTTYPEIKAMAEAFTPHKTSILPPGGMFKPRRLSQYWSHQKY